MFKEYNMCKQADDVAFSFLPFTVQSDSEVLESHTIYATAA